MGKIKNWSRIQEKENGNTIGYWKHDKTGNNVTVRKRGRSARGNGGRYEYEVVAPRRHSDGAIGSGALNNNAVEKYSTLSKAEKFNTGGMSRSPSRKGAMSAARGWMKQHPNP